MVFCKGLHRDDLAWQNNPKQIKKKQKGEKQMKKTNQKLKVCSKHGSEQGLLGTDCGSSQTEGISAKATNNNYGPQSAFWCCS